MNKKFIQWTCLCCFHNYHNKTSTRNHHSHAQYITLSPGGATPLHSPSVSWMVCVWTSRLHCAPSASDWQTRTVQTCLQKSTLMYTFSEIIKCIWMNYSDWNVNCRNVSIYIFNWWKCNLWKKYFFKLALNVLLISLHSFLKIYSYKK